MIFFFFLFVRKTGIREGRHTSPRPFHRNVEEIRRERKSTSFTEHSFQSARWAIACKCSRRALEKWKEWELDEYWTRVTVVGSDSSSRILDQQEYTGISYVLLLSLDLSQCRPRVGCRPSTARHARHRRRHVQYTATPTVTQRAAGLLTQPTCTVQKKNKKKSVRPPEFRRKSRMINN